MVPLRHCLLLMLLVTVTVLPREGRSAALPPGANTSIVRTTDGGTTFQPAGDYNPQWLPRPQGDALYWLADGAIIKTADKGVSWTKLCDLKDGRFGPVFGKDAKHLFVLTGAGIVESRDGGATWAKPIAVPKELKGVSPLTWLDYDPANDALYVMKMTSELYRWERGSKP